MSCPMLPLPTIDHSEEKKTSVKKLHPPIGWGIKMTGEKKHLNLVVVQSSSSALCPIKCQPSWKLVSERERSKSSRIESAHTRLLFPNHINIIESPATTIRSCQCNIEFYQLLNGLFVSVTMNYTFLNLYFKPQ